MSDTTIALSVYSLGFAVSLSYLGEKMFVGGMVTARTIAGALMFSFAWPLTVPILLLTTEPEDTHS